MNSAIHYFSGSGNSLIVARDIVLKLNRNLIPIPSVMHKMSIGINAEVIF
ncbi:MAG: hypothetical protein ACFFDI_28840 [Promethearchaeota archaeon]